MMTLRSFIYAPFAEERRFWRFLTIVLGVFALLKGIRPPSAWALTLSQIDYSQGFVKRGLYGALFPLHQHLPITLLTA